MVLTLDHRIKLDQVERLKYIGAVNNIIHTTGYPCA